MESKVLICNICNYSTKKRGNFNRHLKTRKHIINMAQSNKCEGGEEYDCHLCNYKTNIASNFKKHCKSVRHIQNKAIEFNVKEDNYKIIDLIEKNTELQSKIVEMSNKPHITVQQHNTFNIINYLNTDCKDAYNLSDFINNLVITFEDLEKIERYGYLYGVKQSLIKALHETEQTKRPIHCTDVKRKQFYIKNQNIWERDPTNDKMRNALRQYNNAQIRTLLDWKEENEDWLNDLRKQDKTNRINCELTSMYCDSGDKMQNKILNEICNATVIEK